MRFAGPAEQYDRFMGRYAPTLADALADAAGVRSGMRVLDVGCGPGGLTSELTTRVGAANVAGIDPAPQFVAACRARNPGADVREGGRSTVLAGRASVVRARRGRLASAGSRCAGLRAGHDLGPHAERRVILQAGCPGSMALAR